MNTDRFVLNFWKIAILCVFSFVVAACKPTVTQTASLPSATLLPSRTPQQVTGTRPVDPTSTLTPTRRPSSTPRPTFTPRPTLPPTASLTPALIETLPAHPLALIDSSTAQQMKRLARYGSGPAYDVAWSPDGRYLAVATGIGVFLYDANSLEQARLIDINDPVRRIAFRPDGKALAVAVGGRVSAWDVEAGHKFADMEGEILGGVWTLVYGAGGQIAASGQAVRGMPNLFPQVNVWQAESGKLLFVVEQIFADYFVLDISLDGKTLLYAHDHGIELHDIRDGSLLQKIGVEGSSAIFSADGSQVVVTSYLDSPSSWIYDLASGEQRPVLRETACNELAHSGAWAICDGGDTITIFDARSGETKTTLVIDASERAFAYGSDRAAIHPEGRYLAYLAGSDVQVWDVQSQRASQTLVYDTFDEFVTGMVEWQGVPKYLAATDEDGGQVRLWDLSSGSLLQEWQTSDYEITSLAFSPDRYSLASIGSSTLDGTPIVNLWDITDGQQTYSFTLPYWASGPIQFSPDGSRLAMLGDEIYELNLQNGETKGMGTGSLGYAYLYNLPMPFAYSSQGHLMSWEIAPNVFRLMDLNMGTSIDLPFDWQDESHWFHSFTLSPDGNYVAAGTYDAQIYIWDLRTKELTHILEGHDYWIGDGSQRAFHRLAFSPQGDLLLSIGWDETMRLWDIHSGEQLRLLNVCCYGEFSPDGRILVTAYQGVMRVWGVPPWP